MRFANKNMYVGGGGGGRPWGCYSIERGSVLLMCIEGGRTAGVGLTGGGELAGKGCFPNFHSYLFN